MIGESKAGKGEEEDWEVWWEGAGIDEQTQVHGEGGMVDVKCLSAGVVHSVGDFRGFVQYSLINNYSVKRAPN